jgi:putative ABC transport system ATP-binding protein
VDAAATAGSSKRMALQLLAKVRLADHAHKRPRELSGGQNQRAAIARALVRSPQIIMADEPTAALDRASGREVVELLGHLAREVRCTVILVTHDTRILDIADRILTLEDGRIEESNLALGRLVD